MRWAWASPGRRCPLPPELPVVVYRIYTWYSSVERGWESWETKLVSVLNWTWLRFGSVNYLKMINEDEEDRWIVGRIWRWIEFETSVCLRKQSEKNRLDQLQFERNAGSKRLASNPRHEALMACDNQNNSETWRYCFLDCIFYLYSNKIAIHFENFLVYFRIDLRWYSWKFLEFWLELF